MKRVAVIQARTGSSRLPGKILMDLGGQPMLAQVVRRVRRATLVDEVVVATTERRGDDAVEDLARALGVAVFRGSERDVLSRYVGAARASDADVVIRLTADCPLLDAALIDDVVRMLCDAGHAADYVSNVVRRTYPRGLDVEAMFRDVLERVDRLARSPESREHVTYLILREQPSLFLVRGMMDAEDNSDLRWTVDEAADLEMARTLYRELDVTEGLASYRTILDWVRLHPAVSAINAGVRQKA